MPDELLTAAEARQRYGIWPQTINRWVRDGKLKVVAGRPHNRLDPSRFRANDLERLAKERQPNRSDPEQDAAVATYVYENVRRGFFRGRVIVATADKFSLAPSTVYKALRRHEARLHADS